MKKVIVFVFLLVSALGFSQIKVTGKVTDTFGEPLPGANVIEKGTTKGATADFNGNYEITISSAAAVL